MLRDSRSHKRVRAALSDFVLWPLDAADTTILAGIATDLDTREYFVNVEAERRFGDHLSAEIRVRAFMNAGTKDPLYSFDRDDYVQLRLSWYY